MDMLRSGETYRSRVGESNFAACKLFSLLGTVFRTALFTTLDTLEVQSYLLDFNNDSAYLEDPARDHREQHYGVFLEVMAFTPPM